MPPKEPQKLLTPKQHATILALLSEATIEGAAAKAKVSVRSVYNWLDEPLFMREFHAARAKLLEALIGRLLRVSDKAVAALEDALTSPKIGDRIRAGGILLERVSTVAVAHTLQQEIAELKKSLAVQQVAKSAQEPTPADAPGAVAPQVTVDEQPRSPDPPTVAPTAELILFDPDNLDDEFHHDRN